VGILAATDPNPPLAHPLSGARDDGLPGRQRAAPTQRIGQRLTGQYAGQLLNKRGGTLDDFRGQRVRGIRGLVRALLHQRDATGRQPAQRSLDVLKALHAHCL
jgi:hypothetical protein